MLATRRAGFRSHGYFHPAQNAGLIGTGAFCGSLFGSFGRSRNRNRLDNRRRFTYRNRFRFLGSGSLRFQFYLFGLRRLCGGNNRSGRFVHLGSINSLGLRLCGIGNLRFRLLRRRRRNDAGSASHDVGGHPHFFWP